MTTGDDLDLRERFAALRAGDAANAPSLASLLRARTDGPGVSRARWIPVAALVSAAALTTVALLGPAVRYEPSPDDAIAQAQELGSWTAPTDEWLTLSGLEIPDSVPSLSLSSVTLPETSTDAAAQGESQ